MHIQSILINALIKNFLSKIIHEKQNQNKIRQNNLKNDLNINGLFVIKNGALLHETILANFYCMELLLPILGIFCFIIEENFDGFILCFLSF
jgi:hypothetical protein